MARLSERRASLRDLGCSGGYHTCQQQGSLGIMQKIRNGPIIDLQACLDAEAPKMSPFPPFCCLEIQGM